MAWFDNIWHHNDELIIYTRNVHGTAVKVNLRFQPMRGEVNSEMTEVPPYSEQLFTFDMELMQKLHNGEWTDKLLGYAKTDSWENDGSPPQDMSKTRQEQRRWELIKRRWTKITSGKKNQEIFYHREIAQKIRSHDPSLPNPLQLSFELYRQQVARILFQIIFKTIEQDCPEVVEGKGELVLNYYATDRYGDDDTWCAYEDTTSSLECANFQFSGGYFVGRIIFPWIYLNRIEYASIEKSLAHEFEHYLEQMKGQYDRYYKMKDHIIAFMRENPNAWLGSALPIHAMLCNIYTEGFGKFKESKNAQSVPVSISYIQEAKRLMEKIAGTKSAKKAHQLWDDILTPTSTTGEYYIGWIMCYFIGLSIMRKKQPDSLLLFSQQKTSKWLISFRDRRDLKRPDEKMQSKNEFQLPFDQLQGFLASAKQCFLEQLTPDIFDETKKELDNIMYFDEFIARYEQACKDLGFKPPVKFFDLAFAHRLQDIAQKKVNI
jgi:hypothetical protein